MEKRRKNLEKNSIQNIEAQGKSKEIGKSTKNKIKEVLELPTKTNNNQDFYYPEIIEINDENITNESDNDVYIIPEIIYYNIDESGLNTIRNLQKGYNEEVYLKKFGEPKNVITFGDGKILYLTNCLIRNDRKYIIGYIQKGNELKLRLFYKSKSEGARRSCPGAREGGGYSKGEDIPNSSYETTTKISHELECKFDALPEENTNSDPIKEPSDLCGYEILETEMDNEIHVEKLFSEYPNATCDSFYKKSVPEIINMYKHLGENFDLKNMQYLEGSGYTYEHNYLGTIEVEIGRIIHNGKYLDFYFAKAKNDPLNRVRIEEVSYPNAKITSFGIYDRLINAAPLTGKPIEYTAHVPDDMKGNVNFPGSKYIDIRDLYQQNPIIKRFKKVSSYKIYQK